MSEWKEVRIENTSIDIIDGDRGQNYPKPNEFSIEGYCLFLNAGNVTSTGFNFSSIAFITKEKDELLRKGKLLRGDIVLTTRGTVGNVAHYDSDVPFENVRINSGMVIIRPRNDFDIKYLYHYLRSHLFAKQIHQFQSGTAQPQLPISTIKKMCIPMPSLETQRRIASILSSLDDKIAVNRRICENLEAQAQALFKHWFIDFAPFKDGKFIESELGMIPEGWRVGTLGEIAEITSGKRPNNRYDTETETHNVPLIGASCVMGYTDEVFTSNKILLTGRVGTLGVIQRSNSDCWPSDNTLVISSLFYEFVYQILKTLNYSGMNRGTSQPLITQGDLKKSSIIIPPDAIIHMFEDIASELMSQLEYNGKESKKISTLRDTLLPKLMSGEIKV